MREFNTREAEGDYSITFNTDDRKAYEQVQTLCRIIIDGKSGEAIAKEWIKKWRRDKWLGGEPIEKRTIMAMGVRLMLEDWEVENDKDI